MLRLDHCIRLRYLAVILAWMGYASGLSAAPLQLESTPLFLNVKAEPNVLLMIDDSGSMNWEVMTGDYSNDGRYTNIQRDGSPGAQGRSSIAIMMIMGSQTVVSVVRTRVFMATPMG